MNKKVLACLIIVHGLLFAAISECYASGVTVYPTRFELDTMSSHGKFISRSVTVENFSNKTVRVKANTQSWKLDTQGNIVYLEKPDERSLIDNTRFNPSEFSIGPKQKQLVRFTVKVPDGADGEYREILFFNTVSDKKDVISSITKKLSINVNFESRFGTTIYLYKGATARNASITDVRVEKEKKVTYITATLKNDGNIHTSLKGKVFLKSKSDSQKNTEIPVKYFLLPECSQKLKIKIPDNFITNKNNFAHISLNYLDKDLKVQNIAAEVDFGNDINIVPVNSPSNSLQKLTPAVDKNFK